MTQEEYEKIIQESTDASIRAQADLNAARAAAVASAGVGAMKVRQNESTAGLGMDVQAQTPQEVDRTQAATQQATQQATTPLATQEAFNATTGEHNGVSPMVQQALDAKKAEEEAARKAEAARRAEEVAQQQEAIRSKLNPTTQDFHENEPQEPADADTQYQNDLHSAYEQRAKLFSDYINDVKKRQQQEEEEMQRQEKADMWSTMGTGATELAAGIINMLGVGELNASNQVYHSYSQDWMQRADQNIREHRRRREGMRDTLDRLNYQMNELKTAQSIDELKTRRQLQREKEAKERADREEAYRREKTDRDEAFRREQFDWQKEKAEKAEAAQAAALERQERRDAATIAQGWSRINAERDKTRTSMLAAGWVPDKSAPGGFRYDPEKAKEYGVVVGGSKDKKEGLSLPIIDADGNVNLANVGDKEQLKIIMNTAVNAIKHDLGEEQAKELESRLTMADSDESREAILTEWIGKSPTMEAELKKYDPNYKGNHGGSKGFTGGTMSGDDFIKALNG